MAASTPYLGSKISLISNAEIRYEGTLYTIDSKESTVALYKVRVFGTEDRKTDTPVPPSDDIFEFITFTASDIKDLRVCQPPVPPLVQDPAIVSHSVAPPGGPGGPPGPPSFGDFTGTPYAANQGPPPPPRPLYNINAGAGSSFAAGAAGGGLGLSPPGAAAGNSMLAPGAGLGSLGNRAGTGAPGGEQTANSASMVPPGNGFPPKSGVIDASSCAQSLVESAGGTNSRNSSPDLLTKAMSSGGQGGTVADRRGGHDIEHHHHQQNDRGVGNHHQRGGFRQHQGGMARDGSGFSAGNHHQYYSRGGDGGGYSHAQRRGALSSGPSGGSGYSGSRNNGFPGMMRGGRSGGPMGGNRGRGGGGPRGHTRGQLQATTKEPLKFDEEFDFEQANQEFLELESKMAKAKISEGTASQDDETARDTTTGENGNGGPSNDNEEENGEGKSGAPGSNGDEGAPAKATGDKNGTDESSSAAPAPEYYNKSKSFFDQISCEALERQKGSNGGGSRVDWRHERTINKETFGVAAPPSYGYYRNRGGWGGGYQRGGRGGYGYGGYHRGGRGGAYGPPRNNFNDHGRNYSGHQSFGGGYNSRSYSGDHNRRSNVGGQTMRGGSSRGPRQPQAQQS